MHSHAEHGNESNIFIELLNIIGMRIEGAVATAPYGVSFVVELYM